MGSGARSSGRAQGTSIGSYGHGGAYGTYGWVDPKADLTAGKKIFAETCASCHGDAGKGKRDMGAPNLTDAIWLYGSDKAAIVEEIAVMAWQTVTINPRAKPISEALRDKHHFRKHGPKAYYGQG